MHISPPNAWRASLAPFCISRHQRDWLSDRGSLTKRLQAAGRFDLTVLRQMLTRPTLDEAAVFGIARDSCIHGREVVLFCDGRPIVFAHTILAGTQRGPVTRWLQRLGSRSLGALLFSRIGFSRSPIEFRRIDRRHPLFAPALAALRLAPALGALQLAPRQLWARRSRFDFGRQAVLVTEIFTPDLPAG